MESILLITKLIVMKAMIVTMLIILSAQAFSQQTTSLTKADYLQKSKRQKTTAWILLGGGIATAITGIIIYDHAYNKAAKDDPLLTLFSLGTNVNPTGAIISLAGSLTSIGSVPLFIASAKNRRKAKSLSAGFKIERTLFIRGYVIAKTNYPALSLKINL